MFSPETRRYGAKREKTYGDRIPRFWIQIRSFEEEVRHREGVNDTDPIPSRSPTLFRMASVFLISGFSVQSDRCHLVTGNVEREIFLAMFSARD